MHFHMDKADKQRLEALPWNMPLETWQDAGVALLHIRRGESRHPVVFVDCQGVRYAIKETTPHMAEREIRNLREIDRRGIPVLSAVGSVIVPAPPVALDAPHPGGRAHYISGDWGYTVTRLAPRVVPHSFLYRLPLSKRTKRHLWSAVAVLMVELHEHGVYWGDPSLANVLIRIDGRRILAILADAETAEIFPGPVSDGLRKQDVALFGESLLWQAEDIRLARGLPEDEQILGEEDFRYFERRYRWLQKEHAQLSASPASMTLFHVYRRLQRLGRQGLSLLDLSGRALQEFATVLPGWHQRRIRELLGIKVPRGYARRFYNLMLGHQAIMSQQEGRDVSIEEAAQHWYTYYHLPAILLLRQKLTKGQDPLRAYFAIMRHKWVLSEKAGFEVPLDEAVLDWAMEKAETGQLGAVDPALMATWWRDLVPASQVLEPSLIEGRDLEPLLSTGEKPLVHLEHPALEEQLGEILDQQKPDEPSLE